MARKTTEVVQFKLRITEGLRRQIERSAKQNNRSANAEAADRLEKSFTATHNYQEIFEEIISKLDARYVIKEIQ